MALQLERVEARGDCEVLGAMLPASRPRILSAETHLVSARFTVGIGMFKPALELILVKRLGKPAITGLAGSRLEAICVHQPPPPQHPEPAPRNGRYAVGVAAAAAVPQGLRSPVACAVQAQPSATKHTTLSAGRRRAACPPEDFSVILRDPPAESVLPGAVLTLGSTPELVGGFCRDGWTSGR